MPLESLCLSVKVCLPHSASIQQALGRLLSPPAERAIAAAVHSLKVCTPSPVCVSGKFPPDRLSSCLKSKHGSLLEWLKMCESNSFS